MTKKQPPILRNLDSFSPGAFYLTPSLQLAQRSIASFRKSFLLFSH